MNFYKIILVLSIFVIVILLQNIVHEYSHVIAAKLNGVRVIKIQWFTYSKFLLGTRVFFNKEPTFNEGSIEKKWGWISIAGFINTTVLGYISIIISSIYPKHTYNWLILILCLFSIVFLTFDSLYFVLGSIFNFGDVVGFRRVFKIKKSVSIIFSLLILLSNILLIKLVWYNS